MSILIGYVMNTLMNEGKMVRGKEKHSCCWKGVSNELNFGVDLYGLVILVLWVVVLQTISRLPLSLLYETFVCILCNKVEGCWKMMTKLGLTCSCEEIGKQGIQGKSIIKWNDIRIVVVMGSLGNFQCLIYGIIEMESILRFTLSFWSSNLVGFYVG